jgi:hypothetical protein
MYQTGYYATDYYATGYYSRTAATLPTTLLGYTWYSIIFEARSQLQDDQEGCYRYPDEMLLNALNRGLQDLGRMRPDAFFDLYSGNSLNVPEITVLDWGDIVTIPAVFVPPLVMYVTAQAEYSEDDYVTDGRAAGHMTLFKSYVMGL